MIPEPIISQNGNLQLYPMSNVDLDYLKKFDYFCVVFILSCFKRSNVNSPSPPPFFFNKNL